MITLSIFKLNKKYVHLVFIDFKIVVIISAEDQARNHVASRMSSYIRKLPRLPSDVQIAEYISSHIAHNLEISLLSSSSQEK